MKRYRVKPQGNYYIVEERKFLIFWVRWGGLYTSFYDVSGTVVT